MLLCFILPIYVYKMYGVFFNGINKIEKKKSYVVISIDNTQTS